jgi:hypothetical protein
MPKQRVRPIDPVEFVTTCVAHASKQCETCPWLKRPENEEAEEWILGVCEAAKLHGKMPPLQKIYAVLAAKKKDGGFGYHLSIGALRNHFSEKHRLTWESARKRRR